MSGLSVKIVLPELYEASGKRALVRTLSQRFGSKLFYVVVENISATPLHVWAEGNSLGNDSLSFLLTEPGANPQTLRRIGMDSGKNVLRTERLEPGVCHVRAVLYGQQNAWDVFPFVPNTSREIRLQAVFQQAAWLNKRNIWQGKVISAPCHVMLDGG